MLAVLKDSYNLEVLVAKISVGARFPTYPF
uniref:Uncharacterized protein n=1 Tax=virus sp. ctML55 TaxID=2827627 RepID=A0A8S5RIU2_9VIRU|nr:MAG TPA: Protein of unknown function (DUF1590) [virus sp. ctML55]